MEAVVVQNEEDEQRFRKIQLTDQDNFAERLNSLQVSCTLFVCVISLNNLLL